MEVDIGKNSSNVQGRKLCFRRDRPESSGVFSFMHADLCLWAFFLVFILFVTVSLSRLS